MPTDLIASLVDTISIIAVCGYLLFARRSIVATIGDPAKRERTDRILRICLPLAIGCSVFLAAGKIASFEDDLSKLARQANASLPKLIEPTTRLDLITVGKPRRLVYHMTAMSGPAKDVDRIRWRQEKVKMEERIRSSADLKKLLGAGITLVYRYSDKDNVFIDELVVSPMFPVKK